MIGTQMDVTERKRIGEDLLQAKEQLRRHAESLEKTVKERTAKMQEMIDELQHVSYSIVHDMRAPLRAMRSFALMLEEECASCPRNVSLEYLGRIQTASARMDRLITDALQYTKAVLEEVPLAPVNLAELVRGLLQTYPNLHPDKAEILLEGELPVVLGNEALLTQCFSNLLGNAVKFVDPGRKPQVRIRAERSDGTTRIWVEDNGIGIPAHAHGRLFGMFQRLNSKYEGTGIGLAIVRKVVERMDGKVGVESEAGKGSRFWVELRHAEGGTEGA
jgi:signal transduction histidine kinase